MPSKNPIFQKSGSDIIYYPILLIVLAFICYNLAYRITYNWPMVVVQVVGLNIATAYMWRAFKNPKLLAWTVVFYSFMWSMIARYTFAYLWIKQPFGLGVDFLMALTLGAIIFSGGRKTPYHLLKNRLVILSFTWFFFVFLQYFNPFAASREAWIYAMRCYALYLFLSIIIVYLLLNTKRDLQIFLIIFISVSIFGGLYGWYQLNIGLNFADSVFIQPKLDRHMLWGKLRVFSIYENAGQAGVSLGHAGLISTILMVHDKRMKYRVFYFLGMTICFYGMAISGTRGALIVPILGLGVYLLFCRMLWVTVSGCVVGAILLFILVFTTIGQSNYTINRMRTAFDKNDPSYQYRLEARRHYQDYMDKHLFGWGIGSAGYWGNRFLGEENYMKGTDGGYVQLHAEIGRAGLIFYWFYYSFVLGLTFWMLLKSKTSLLYYKILALSCGVIGLLAANYGNSVIYQMPSNLLVSISLAYMWLARTWMKGQEFPKFQSNFD
jgi:hypothetical protein